MTKTDLIKSISTKAGITKKDSEKALDATISTIMEAVVGGDVVKLVGFGTFEARERSSRMGRNPKTNESLEIPATIVPAFKASKVFKEMVAKG